MLKQNFIIIFHDLIFNQRFIIKETDDIMYNVLYDNHVNYVNLMLHVILSRLILLQLMQYGIDNVYKFYGAQ